jgi:hypothetical protein
MSYYDLINIIFFKWDVIQTPNLCNSPINNSDLVDLTPVFKNYTHYRVPIPVSGFDINSLINQQTKLENPALTIV